MRTGQTPATGRQESPYIQRKAWPRCCAGIARYAPAGAELLDVGLAGGEDTSPARSCPAALRGRGQNRRLYLRDVPEFHRPIHSRRRNQFPVMRESHEMNAALMSLKVGDLPARSDIPEAEGTIETTGGERLIVGRTEETLHAQKSSGEAPVLSTNGALSSVAFRDGRSNARS